MAQIRTKKELYNTSVAGTGDWYYTTNGKWDEGKDYSVSFSITAGDTVRIETTNDTEKASTGKDTVVASPLVTKSVEFDSTESGTVIRGSWKAMRVVKTNATGNAKVQAEI